jgi:hypothetical protein
MKGSAPARCRKRRHHRPTAWPWYSNLGDGTDITAAWAGATSCAIKFLEAEQGDHTWVDAMVVDEVQRESTKPSGTTAFLIATYTVAVDPKTTVVPTLE